MVIQGASENVTVVTDQRYALADLRRSQMVAVRTFITSLHGLCLRFALEAGFNVADCWDWD